MKLTNLLKENKSVNEARVSAKKLLQSVVNGETDRVEGIKLSKEMAQSFLDWQRLSPYGKKYGGLPFNRLFTAAFSWGLHRYADKKSKEYKELEAKANQMFKARRGESVNEGLTPFKTSVKDGNMKELITKYKKYKKSGDIHKRREVYKELIKLGNKFNFKRDDWKTTGRVSGAGEKAFAPKYIKFYSESLNEAKYDIGMARKGNGITVYNRAEEENGDYKNVAHIDSKGKVKYYDKKIPSNIKKEIEQKAAEMMEMATESGMKLTDLLGEDVYVKNKETGNVYKVKNANPAKHEPPSKGEVEKAKADDAGSKEEPKKEPKDEPKDSDTSSFDDFYADYDADEAEEAVDDLNVAKDEAVDDLRDASKEFRSASAEYDKGVKQYYRDMVAAGEKPSREEAEEMYRDSGEMDDDELEEYDAAKQKYEDAQKRVDDIKSEIDYLETGLEDGIFENIKKRVSMKLTDLIKESNVQIGKVYSNPYAKSWVKEEEEQRPQAEEMTEEHRAAFFEAVKGYKTYGESVYRKEGLTKVYESIKGMVEMANKVTLAETGDWFDGVTVSRHMKRMNESFKVFEKTLREVSTLQQRLESSYDEIGEVLGKYYEINELEEGNEFGAARAKAIAAGDDSFEVDGKTYKVTNVDKDDKENAKKFANESMKLTSLLEGASTEEKRIVMLAVRKIAKYRNVDIKIAAGDVMRAAQELERDIEKGKVKK